MRETVVLIGAGSAMFTRGLVSDLIRAGWQADLRLVDTDPAALRVAEGLARKMVEMYGAPIAVSACLDRRAALTGATVVICTIGVGGRRAWEQDVFIPRKYGIYQPVGDSVMPGGTSRALRMIPAMLAIARDVLDLCPQALFFNYGNPMAAVCRAVRKATGAPMIGLCHGVFHVARYLARELGVDVADLSYSAVGMNHLTWFTRVEGRTLDLMPRLHDVADRKLAGVCDEPFSWRLFKLYGAFPAVLDRHVTEFFPQFFADGRYYGRTLGVDAFSFEETIALGDRIYGEMQQAASSPQPLGPNFFDRLDGEHEQVVEIVESIRCHASRVYSVNVPNVGQVANLPLQAIIECPAAAHGEGLSPIVQPMLSPGLVGTLASHLAWVETVVEAALEGSRDKFIQALVIDGAVNSIETAATMADELLAAHAPYLPQFA